MTPPRTRRCVSKRESRVFDEFSRSRLPPRAGRKFLRGGNHRGRFGDVSGVLGQQSTSGDGDNKKSLKLDNWSDLEISAIKDQQIQVMLENPFKASLHYNEACGMKGNSAVDMSLSTLCR